MRMIIEHLARYVASKDDMHPDLASWNLATGTAGLALLYEALVPIFPGPWHERAEGALAQTLVLLAADPYANDECGLFTGLSGVCQVVSLFAQLHPEYQLLKMQLDRQLCACIRRQYASSERLYEGVTFRDYDVISGPAGIASYLLSLVVKEPSSETAETFDCLLKRLIALSQPDAQNVNHPYLFIPPHRAPYRTYAERYPQGATDCGFAHGLPGVLALLSLCHILYARERNDLSLAISTLARWLVEHGFETAQQVRWPLVISGASSTMPGGSFWCYGASGVAWALWLAGLAVREAMWQNLAIRTMKTIYHDALKQNEYLSPILCHGLAGLLQVVEGFALYTNEAFLEHFRQLLLQRLFDQFDASLPSGFVTTQVLGSQAMGKGEPSKTADMAASRERPCLRMVER